MVDEVKNAAKAILFVDTGRFSRAETFEDFDDLFGEIFVRAIFDVHHLQARAHRTNGRRMLSDLLRTIDGYIEKVGQCTCCDFQDACGRQWITEYITES